MRKTDITACCSEIANLKIGWFSDLRFQERPILDESGNPGRSMRKTDIADGATRSDAVWVTLAMDFVLQQLESGEVRHASLALPEFYSGSS